MALALGAAVVIGAAVAWHLDSSAGTTAAYSHSVGGITFPSGGHDAFWTTLIAIGAAILLAGIIRTTPTLLSRISRRAAALPLALRLATRDAARHRHRTVPATAAVATVVAGAVLLLFVVSSTDTRDRKQYTPYTPVGTVSVYAGMGQQTLDGLDRVTGLVAQALDAPEHGAIGLAELPRGVRAEHRGCESFGHEFCAVGAVGVADVEAVGALIGADDPQVRSALARGAAVVIGAFGPRTHSVPLDEVRGSGPDRRTTQVAVPTVHMPSSSPSTVLPAVVVSPETAAAHGWNVRPLLGIVRPAHLPSQDRVDSLEKAFGPHVGIRVERGYHGHVDLALLAFVGAAAVAGLLGTSIAVALAMAEARSDMSTLAAVGASPARRRVHAMAQAATVGGLGSLLGLGLGIVVGVALLLGSTSYPFSFPVRWLALVAVATPLLGVAVAGLSTRARMPLTRRVG